MANVFGPHSIPTIMGNDNGFETFTKETIVIYKSKPFILDQFLFYFSKIILFRHCLSQTFKEFCV
jgi:hypothetical protein